MRKMTHGFSGTLSSTKIAVAPFLPAFPILKGRHLTHRPHRHNTGTQRAHIPRHTEVEKNDTRPIAISGKLSLPVLQLQRAFQAKQKKVEKNIFTAFCHIFSLCENVSGLDGK